MKKITEQKYKQIIHQFNNAADKEASALATVLSSWGRNSEIERVFASAEKKKCEFVKLFD